MHSFARRFVAAVLIVFMVTAPRFLPAQDADKAEPEPAKTEPEETVKVGGQGNTAANENVE